jgi:hypothetical protein
MVGTLVVATLWATAQPLPESAILSADALIINAADGIDVETLAQACDLLTAHAVQYAYLAGSQRIWSLTISYTAALVPNDYYTSIA